MRDAQDYAEKILGNPTTGDEFGFRGAIQSYAQKRSDGLFSPLASVLGGASPGLNFVQTDNELTSNHMSANLADNHGAAKGTINIDPYATTQFVIDTAPEHSGWTNQMPHEMAHTRQTNAVLRSTPDAEGGAQAFADLVTAAAAQKARIPYTPGYYDGSYSDFVKAAQARGNDWLLNGQFGRTGSTWP